MAVDELLETGRAALEAGRWEDALTAFQASLTEEETPEALDGIAAAFWWLCDARSSIRYRERAYQGFRQAGDTARAAATAVSLSITYLFNLGNEAASRGWLARAERLLRQTDPNPLQGWLWDMRSFLTTDREHARELLERALECAREFGDLDLELVVLADLGLAIVAQGRVEEGMAMLDEAMAGTLGGECSRLDTVVFASCNMLSACNMLGDIQRASDWCRVADVFMRDYSSPFLFAHCRAHYGSILFAKGQWQRAEAELQAALKMSEDIGPGARSEAVARLAFLRLRQGGIEEAEALLAESDDVVASALPAAAVRLARGEAPVAIGLLERRLDYFGDGHIEVAPSLSLLVDAHLANLDLKAATEAATRLDELARAQHRPHAIALASLASAHVSTARGQHDEAIGHLESALRDFTRLDLPLETAQVRLDLASALAERRPDLAAAEASRALAAFEQLGAARDADAAASLLRSLGAPARTGPKHVGVLTRREQEVLGLVGLGLSNPEIAERLFISRKTAAHHVSNLLAKLGLRNRAEAAAYVARSHD